MIDSKISRAIRKPVGGRPSRGFTLTEFIVVVVIFAVLLGLLLPAIQAARESARREQCQRKVRLLALACLNHEQGRGFFPTGGWGGAWTGDADLGDDRKQPGGWKYNLIPFSEISGLYELGSGMSGAAKDAANLHRLAVVSPYSYCPTRRPAETYPWRNAWPIVNAGMPKMVARTDYAANGGDVYTSPGWPQPPLWKSAPPGDGLGPASLAEGGVGGSAKQRANAKKTFDNIAKAATGVVYCGSAVNLADITDGASATYLLGEKYIDPDFYATGEDPGDSKAALVGDSEDVSRWTLLPPLGDTPGYVAPWRFGSAHPSGFNMAFCDGAAKFVSYAIDPDVYRRLGNRSDEQPAKSRAGTPQPPEKGTTKETKETKHAK